METEKPHTMTQMNLPREQRAFCKAMKMSFTDAYIFAFEQVFMKGNAKLMQRQKLLDELTTINAEIEKDKTKPYNKEETKFLRETQLEVTEKQLALRYTTFRRTYKRDFVELNEFIGLVQKAKEKAKGL